jgi:hypothetical protein
MSIRRLAVLPLIVAGVLAVIGTVNAQFPKIPKVPKAPVPGAKTADPAPPTPATRGFVCSHVNEDLINRFLKAQEAKKKAYDEEMAKSDAVMAKARAKQAEADALAKKRAASTMNTMMANAECKDAFKEKDPRSKEIARLEALVADADEKNDQAKSDQVRKRLDPLNEALEIDADRACGGKGSAALHDCMAQKKATLAKQGITEPMLTIQAQGECMQDPSTSGIAGMTAASPEEEALLAEQKAAAAMADQARADAESKGQQAERDALGMDERDHGLFLECIMNVLREDPSEPAPESNERTVIRKHKEALRKALGWQ